MTMPEHETEIGKRNRIAKEDANWKQHPDVDYIDLDFFIDNCRCRKDKDSFDTALRILQAIRKQVLERK